MCKSVIVAFLTVSVLPSLNTADGHSFGLERGHSGHIFKEFNIAAYKPDMAMKMPAGSRPEPRRVAALRGAAARQDNTTMVTYSIMFYYTPSMAANTADIPGFIDQVLAETNQGYANNLVPLTAIKHCIELATIDDVSSSSTMLSNFKDMKGSVDAVRHSADAAALIVQDFSSCGIGYLDTISWGWTLSVTQKSCATGYYSFGHEVGHNIGLHHDPDTSTNSDYSYGHGHLIAAGNGQSGARTILGYNAAGHSTRVNYYSSASQVYPPTGTPLGVAGLSDNAWVLLHNRIALSAVGDESAVCADGSSATTTTTTAAPAPSGSGSSSGSTCGNCVFPFMAIGRWHSTCTTIDGDSNPWCATQTDATGGMVSGAWEHCTDSSCPGITNPEMTVAPANAAGSCFCGVPNTLNTQRIVGGVPTDIGEYPWQVALLFGSALANQGCGGALVGDRYVVTAAHCTDGSSAHNLFVRVGDTILATEAETASFTVQVAEIRQHPDYNSANVQNDISILVLSTPVDLYSYSNIKPICLPVQDKSFAGSTATVSGWGTVSSGGAANSHLHEVDVSVFGDGNCGSMNGYMTADMLCAGLMEGGKDACQGDSGGPLFTNDTNNNGAQTLIGVVSWGFGCADADALGIYAEVAYFRDWLDSQMTDINTCPASTEGSTPQPPSPAPTPAPPPPPPPPSTGNCGNCVFPFTLGNRIFNTCTTIDGDATPWCATQVDASGNYVAGNWEYCQSDCPGVAAPAMTINPLNAAGSCCKYQQQKNGNE